MTSIAPMWQFNAQRMRALPDDLSGLQAVMRSNLFAVQSTDPGVQQRSAGEWTRILDRRYPDWRNKIGELGESRLVPPEFCFLYDGRYVSLDFYKKLLLALEVVAAEHQSVLEIGPGYGQVQRILRYIAPAIRLIVIDIPESLRRSELFLAMEAIDCEFVSSESFGGVGGTIDCLLNSSSFGEMTDDACAGYLEHFGHITRMVLLNRMLNTYCPWRESNREREGHWYFNLPWQHGVERWELEPDFTRIPGPEFSGHHRELFLVLNRTIPIAKPNVQAIQQQSWFTERSNCPSTRPNNILGPDHEVLRAMLEAIRVRQSTPPGVLALDMLLWYLHACQLRRPFEELPFLWGLFHKWSGTVHPTEPFSRPFTAPFRHLTTKLAQFRFRRLCSPIS